MLTFIDIPLDPGATCSCRGCDAVPAGTRTSSPSFRDAAEVEDDLTLLSDEVRGAGVIFTGSAPTAHPEFERVVHAALATGTRRVGVRTDGVSGADKPDVDGLLALGIRLFELVLLGSSADVHDRHAGAPGSFNAAIACIAAVHSAADEGGVRVAVRGRIPVCTHNARDLPSIVMRLAEAGVTDVSLVCGPGCDPRRHLEWVGAACDTGTVNRVWVSVAGVTPGLLGERALHATDVLTLTAGGAER